MIGAFLNAWFVLERPSTSIGSDLAVDENYAVQEALLGRLRPLYLSETMPRLEDRWGRHALTATHRLYLEGRPTISDDYRVRGPYTSPQQVEANAGRVFYIDRIYDPGGKGDQCYVDVWEERR